MFVGRIYYAQDVVRCGMVQDGLGEVKKRKYETLTKGYIAMPKNNGRVPVVGEVIELYERQIAWREKTYEIRRGRFMVVSKTNFLVLCEVLEDGYRDTRSPRVESYHVTDFRAGLLVYRIAEEEAVSLKKSM